MQVIIQYRKKSFYLTFGVADIDGAESDAAPESWKRYTMQVLPEGSLAVSSERFYNKPPNKRSVRFYGGPDELRGLGLALMNLAHAVEKRLASDAKKAASTVRA